MNKQYWNQRIEKILENKNINFGWDAKTNEFKDMVVAGIIDPVKVVRKAVENAAREYLRDNALK